MFVHVPNSELTEWSIRVPTIFGCSDNLDTFSYKIYFGQYILLTLHITMNHIECAGCHNSLVEEGIKCSACQMYFHFGCSHVKEVVYRGWSEEQKQSWKCSLACRQMVAKIPAINDITMSMLDSQGSVSQQLAKLAENINLLVKSVQHQSDKLDDIMKTISVHDSKMKSHEKQLAAQEKKIAELTDDNIKLKKELSGVKASVTDLEQYSRNRNIEIYGIQEKAGENLKKVVSCLAKELRIQCDEKDIDVAHRLPLPRVGKSKRKAIIVQFSSRTCRDEWLKKRKTGLVSNNIIASSDDEPIYVNVNLSPQRKELYYYARVAKKKLNYKFCWVSSSGDIFMKKAEGTNVLAIKSLEDIPKSVSVTN